MTSAPSATAAIAQAAATEVIDDATLAAIRIVLLEGDPADGTLTVVATASAQNLAGGALSDAAIRAALAESVPAPLLIANARTDGRFATPYPGAFVGVPLVASGRPVGYLEAYTPAPPALAQAAQIEEHAQRLADAIGSARETLGYASSDRGTVLVCDDDAGIRALLKHLLGRRGFNVVDVDNGLLAYETARRVHPDLVLIDWVMPLMDGRETVMKLKSDDTTRDIPVIMLTSQSAVDDKVAALEAGAQDFLTKPFDGRELVARLEQQMRWRKLLAEPTTEQPSSSAAAPPPAPNAASTMPAPAAPVASAAAPANDEPIAIPNGDVWAKAVEAAQLGKHREALALYMHEAERSESTKQYPRAAIAFRSASAEAGKMRNPDLGNKLLRLAGKMYLTWSETAQDAKAIQEGYLAAARCFLSAGNLQLAKRSIDFAHSYDSALSDEPPAAD